MSVYEEVTADEACVCECAHTRVLGENARGSLFVSHFPMEDTVVGHTGKHLAS